MLESLKGTWRSLRARQPLTVLDVIAEDDTSSAAARPAR
jgi:hypothetical protein